jgi:hypothetical protein
MNNREILIDIMFDHELDRQDLAELVLVDRETVNSWLVSNESARHIDIPDMAIELLKLKLGIAHANNDSASLDAPNES